MIDRPVPDQTPELPPDDDSAAEEFPPVSDPEQRSLPVLPVSEIVLFPYTLTSLVVNDHRSVELVEDVTRGDRLLVMQPLAPASADATDPTTLEQFHPFGCVGRVVRMLRFPDDSLRVLVRGTSRAHLDALEAHEPYLRGTVTLLQPHLEDTVETEALARNALTQFQRVISLSPNLPEDLRIALLNVGDYSRMADLIADSINLGYEEKLNLLGLTDVRSRLELLATFLNRETVVLAVESEIQSRVNEAFTEGQREHFLREQLKAVQEQLGERPETPEVAELRERIERAGLPGKPREAALRELERLRQMHPSAADYNVSRTYVDWILALPWDRRAPDTLDLKRVKAILDRDHYDLSDVKERILEFLAVLTLRGDAHHAPILCLVGPPGVGKTSLGRSIAAAMGREMIRLSLGGVHDEAEIRGHRRTYVGALPGRIIQGIRNAGSANPVFMLDEIDKLGRDFRGDPSSALLEVLDPEQNSSFSDHYLEVPFDLSRVLFITTANLTDPIPPALFDRMEFLRIPGYTRNEKRHIARRFLIPRQLHANGLSGRQLVFRSSALDEMIGVYTSEAGVRNLERAIAKVARKRARRIVEGDVDAQERLVLTGGALAAFLGPPKIFPETVPQTPQVGQATGLAWTAAGGEILVVEVTAGPGKGNLQLTGSLGEVMRESAQIALSFVRSCHAELGIDIAKLGETDIHIHVPAGATPKDGPSAGITIAVALASLFTGRGVQPRLAMTGELSLRGRILPVGGVKEKTLAAARAGIQTVLLPDANRNDLDEVPEEVREKVDFVPIKDARDAFRLALVSEETPAEHGPEDTSQP
jgi:ATP-dependent Lon protease